MNEITIRKATIEDIETIQNLNHKLCLKENSEFDPTINTEYSLSDSGYKYFKWRIEGSDSITLIAVNGGNNGVGYLIGAVIDTYDYSTIRCLAEAENMYIEESYRNQGIGGKLITQFEDWCSTKKVERVRYVASADNKEAIKFYKNHGASEVSVTLEKDI